MPIQQAAIKASAFFIPWAIKRHSSDLLPSLSKFIGGYVLITVVLAEVGELPIYVAADEASIDNPDSKVVALRDLPYTRWAKFARQAPPLRGL
jgi:hypothetical protein